MYPPKVAFLAVGSNDEKGRGLEQLTGAAWGRLGFRGLTFNAYSTGEEIDVTGSHVVSGEILKAQCKAYKKPIGTTPLKQFLGDIVQDRGYSVRTTGVFISLSGFTGTARRWYQELHSDQREWFKLIDGEQFLSQMEQAKVVSSRDVLLERWQRLTSLEISSLFLMVSDRGAYWMVGLADSCRSDAYYFFATSRGDVPRDDETEYLAARVKHPAPHARRVRLHGREAIVGDLLRHEQRTRQQLADDTLQSIEDVSSAVASLLSDGVAAVKGEAVSLRLEFDAFTQLVKMSLGNADELVFMRSSYFAAAKEHLLVPLVQGRFSVTFESSEREVVLNILSISPRALGRGVLGDAEKYRNSEEHLCTLSISAERAAETRRHIRTMMIQDFARDLLLDHEEQRSEQLESDYDIKHVRMAFDMKFATDSRCFIGVKGRWRYSRLQNATGQEIRAGQLVTFSGPGPVLEAADALVTMHEYDEAVVEYDRVIRDWPGTDAQIAATHNKGRCLLRAGRLDEAEELFEAVVDMPLARRTALSNLVRVHSRKGRREQAENLLEMIQIEYGLDESLAELCSEARQLLCQEPQDQVT
jgi:tetratricopeptide (TPR) repeat protein